MSFDDLGLDADLLRAVAKEGYSQATPVQQAAIPSVLAGRDVMAAAQTGTGKTAAFTLPLLQRLGRERAPSKKPRALVMTPTRELAAQIADSVDAYGKHTGIRQTVVFGGVNIKPQMATLQRGVEVLVATPGRLLDLAQQNAVDLGSIEILVLDEADRMLDMGFIHDIKRIMKLLPPVAKRQNLMFSATFSADIKRLAADMLTDPVLVEVAPPNATADRVDQSVVFIDKGGKREALSSMIGEGDWRQVLVFTRTKHGANRLAEQLDKDGHSAMAIHGNKSQSARTRALDAFKKNSLRVLVATDIAARGLDIEYLPHVVNFELPNVPEDYVHRIGRTARAGQSGQAVSLVGDDERKLLGDIERLIGRSLPRLDGEHRVQGDTRNVGGVESPTGRNPGGRGERRPGGSGGRPGGRGRDGGANRPSGGGRGAAAGAGTAGAAGAGRRRRRGGSGGGAARKPA